MKDKTIIMEAIIKLKSGELFKTPITEAELNSIQGAENREWLICFEDNYKIMINVDDISYIKITK